MNNPFKFNKPLTVKLAILSLVLLVIVANVLNRIPKEDNGIYTYPPNATMVIGDIMLFEESREITSDEYLEIFVQMMEDRKAFYERHPITQEE